MIKTIEDQINGCFEKNIARLEINEKLIFHLLPLGQSFHQEKEANSIIIYEDLWLNRREFYRSLLSNTLGINSKIHARKTKVLEVDKSLFNAFLDENHYLKSVNCKVRLGLFLEDKLVMVAGFSKPKLMYRESKKYQSSLLIRVSTLSNNTVQGGLSKLIQHFVKHYNPTDIVTYIDKDFFEGSSFLKLGFKLYQNLEPVKTWLEVAKNERFTIDQLIKSNQASREDLEKPDFNPKGFVPIWNSGVEKWVWELE